MALVDINKSYDKAQKENMWIGLKRIGEGIVVRIKKHIGKVQIFYMNRREIL